MRIVINNNLKDFFTLGIGKVLQIIISLASIRLITELLSEDQIGTYYVLLTILSLLAFGFFNPLGQFYARHLIHWQESKNLKNATNIVLVLRFIAILLSLPLALFIFYLFDYQRYFSLLEYIIYITFALVALTHGMLLSAVNILVSRVVFTVYTVVTLALGLASSLVIFQFNQTAMGWLYGLALVQILTSVSLYRRIVTGSDFSLTRVKFSINKNYYFVSSMGTNGIIQADS